MTKYTVLDVSSKLCQYLNTFFLQNNFKPNYNSSYSWKEQMGIFDSHIIWTGVNKCHAILKNLSYDTLLLICVMIDIYNNIITETI